MASPSSTVPNLGASGAIAAVMGAFLVTYPRDRMRSLLVILRFRARDLRPRLRSLIVVWFLIELSECWRRRACADGRQSPYLAHVGGCVFGCAGCASGLRILNGSPNNGSTNKDRWNEFRYRPATTRVEKELPLSLGFHALVHYRTQTSRSVGARALAC